MPRSKIDLTRPGEPWQVTKTGIIIPVPTREQFEGTIGRAAKPAHA